MTPDLPTPGADPLRDRLHALQPTPDTDAALGQVAGAAGRRRTQQRVLAGAAAVIVLVLIAGVAVANSGGRDKASEIEAATGPGTTAGTTPGSSSTSALSTGTTFVTGTTGPAPTDPAPTDPANAGSTTPQPPSTMSPTTSFPVTTVRPPNGLPGAVDVSIESDTAALTVGERTIVTVQARNNLSVPIYHHVGSSSCPLYFQVTASDTPEYQQPIDYTGTPFPGPGSKLGTVIGNGGNAFTGGWWLPLEGQDRFGPDVCTADLQVGTIEPGGVLRKRYVLDGLVAPGPAPAQWYVNAAFRFTTDPGRGHDPSAGTEVANRHTVTTLDSGARAGDMAPVYEAFDQEPTVRGWLDRGGAAGVQFLADMVYVDGAWEIRVTRFLMINPAATITPEGYTVRIEPSGHVLSVSPTAYP